MKLSIKQNDSQISATWLRLLNDIKMPLQMAEIRGDTIDKVYEMLNTEFLLYEEFKRNDSRTKFVWALDMFDDHINLINSLDHDNEKLIAVISIP